MGIVSRSAKRIATEAADARLLGASYLRHWLGRALGRSQSTVKLTSGARVVLRPSEPDLASFRHMIGYEELAIRVPKIASAIARRYEEICAKGATPVVVDAGAYVGAASLWFAKAFPKAQVVALEPDPESGKILDRNVADVANVRVMHAAAAAHPGHVRVVEASESWANSVEHSDSGIEAVTMNDAFASVPHGEPFIGKVNIEGFESDLFSANLEWLDRIMLLYIEPHDWLLPGEQRSASFQKALGERDFHLLIAGSNLCYVRL